ncbi:unnamed protein product, partial [marine sediment metagenome]
EFLDVSQKRGEVDIPDVEIDPLNDTAVYLMTGGTTGVPKPAIITSDPRTTKLSEAL